MNNISIEPSQKMPFHQWKQFEIARLGGWFNAGKPREYYWKRYGDYCNKVRDSNEMICLELQRESIRMP